MEMAPEIAAIASGRIGKKCIPVIARQAIAVSPAIAPAVTHVPTSLREIFLLNHTLPSGDPPRQNQARVLPVYS